MRKVTSVDKTADSVVKTKIAKLAGKLDKRTLAIWAADCAERALPRFEKKYHRDKRPRKAIEACRAWVRTGVFKMADVRGAALAAHAAARKAEEGPARAAARAAGQAMATAHVAGHAVAAADYAAKAAKAPEKERAWQYKRLSKLRGR